MAVLTIIFAILAILCGIWAFAATAVWVGAKVLFWVFLALFVLSLIATPWWGRRAPGGPLP